MVGSLSQFLLAEELLVLLQLFFVVVLLLHRFLDETLVLRFEVFGWVVFQLDLVCARPSPP